MSVKKETIEARPQTKDALGIVKHIAFTMYSVKDMERARRFYEEILGLQTTCVAARGKWVEYHLNNGCFAITTMAEDVNPSANSGGSIAFEVDDVDVMIRKLRAKNIAVKIEPFSTPVCRMAVVLDPEGNALSIHAKKSSVAFFKKAVQKYHAPYQKMIRKLIDAYAIRHPLP